MRTETSYLGMRLAHPFIAGASPMGYRLDDIKRLEDAGAAAVVLHSLFEEQLSPLIGDRLAGVNVSDPAFADIVDRFPPASDYPLAPDAYAEHVFRAKRAVAVPIIASLNGTTGESWLRFARALEQAGADALELNLYHVALDLDASGVAIERRIVGAVGDLKRVLRIPIAVKLSPFFSALGNVASQIDRAGADGLVLFNRFYQPDIDIRTMEVVPRVELSTSNELPLRLRWIAALTGRVRGSLAVSGGVATPDDGIKAILAGADAVQMVSAILRHGPGHIAQMRQGLERWLEWQHITCVDEARGRLSLEVMREPDSYERAQYIKTLHSWMQ